MTFTAIGDVIAGLGEGPVWVPTTGEVLWLDIPGGLLHRTDFKTGRTSTRALGDPLALVLPTGNGDLVVARGDDLLLLPADGGTEHTLASFPHRRNMRLNDGIWDRQGRLLVGTMVLPGEEGGPAGLWRVTADGERSEVVADLRLSNGLAWTPDGRRLFHIDTPVRRIWAHDVGADGSITRSSIVVEIEAGVGNPDGLTVDADGNVWVCLFRGWALRCYSGEGRLLTQIDLPVQHPSSCAFGGDGLQTLFVTTASNRLDEAGRLAQPLAGRLLAADVGSRGHAGVAGLAPEQFRSPSEPRRRASASTTRREERR